MSDLTSPIADVPSQAAVYTAALVAALGSRDPLDVIRESPAAYRAAIDGLTQAQCARPEAPGKWSALQVLQHLTDSELVFGYRLRLVLTQDRPAIVGYDQDLWVERLHAGDDDVERLLVRITSLRAGNVLVLAATTPADRERVGVHSERGEESVGRMLQLYAGHDVVHLRQLGRIRRAVAGA